MNRRKFLIPVPFVLTAMTWFISKLYSQESRAAQEDDIREAIVRYQIANWDLHADVFFLEILSKDPTDKFLNRFVNISRPVRKKSFSTEEKNVMRHVIEKKTKKFGVVFNQEAIKWDSDSVAEVEGGYHCGSLCWAGGTYRVERKSNRWIVTQFKISIIS